MIDIILLSIAFIGLVTGTITDIKTREVPDWVNFSLIFAGLGIRGLYSAISSDWMFFAYGLFGLVAFVTLGYIMFYAGQWGGGDSKLLMGLGALIGLKLSLDPTPLLLIFLINVLLVGSVYGLIYSIVLAVKHRKKFVKNFKKLTENPKIIKIRKIFLISLIPVCVLILALVKDIIMSTLIIVLILILYISMYAVFFVKAVELSAMYKRIAPSKLTEGDWIAKEIIINGKKIVGPKDLGIERNQIQQLIRYKKSGKIKKVLIKVGIPFVPSFLIAFTLSFFGAWWVFLI